MLLNGTDGVPQGAADYDDNEEDQEGEGDDDSNEELQVSLRDAHAALDDAEDKWAPTARAVGTAATGKKCKVTTTQTAIDKRWNEGQPVIIDVDACFLDEISAPLEFLLPPPTKTSKNNKRGRSDRVDPSRSKSGRFKSRKTDPIPTLIRDDVDESQDFPTQPSATPRGGCTTRSQSRSSAGGSDWFSETGDHDGLSGLEDTDADMRSVPSTSRSSSVAPLLTDAASCLRLNGH